jgi:hypothetical protein
VASTPGQTLILETVAIELGVSEGVNIEIAAK